MLKLQGDAQALQIQQDDLQRQISQQVVRDYDAEVVGRTLRDFQRTFDGLEPQEQAETLQCVLKGVLVYPDRIALEVYELAELGRGSQNRSDWLGRCASIRP